MKRSLHEGSEFTKLIAANAEIARLRAALAERTQSGDGELLARATSQEAFEGWMASSNYPEIADIALEKLPDGNYKSQITFAAWQAWQGCGNTIRALSRSSCTQSVNAEMVEEIVGKAMEDAWNEICSDTGFSRCVSRGTGHS